MAATLRVAQTAMAVAERRCYRFMSSHRDQGSTALDDLEGQRLCEGSSLLGFDHEQRPRAVFFYDGP